MLNDLEALAPPLLVCIAFGVGVAAFLKREMGAKEGSADDDKAQVSRDPGNPGAPR